MDSEMFLICKQQDVKLCQYSSQRDTEGGRLQLCLSWLLWNDRSVVWACGDWWCPASAVFQSMPSSVSDCVVLAWTQWRLPEALVIQIPHTPDLVSADKPICVSIDQLRLFCSLESYFLLHVGHLSTGKWNKYLYYTQWARSIHSPLKAELQP